MVKGKGRRPSLFYLLLETIGSIKIKVNQSIFDDSTGLTSDRDGTITIVLFRKIDDLTGEEVIVRVTDCLRKNNYCVLATCHENTPFLRVTWVVFLNDAFYFATNNNSLKLKHIAANPSVEFLVPVQGDILAGSFNLRFAATASRVQNTEEIRQVADHCGFIKKYWMGIEDPRLVLIKLEVKNIFLLKYGEMFEKKLDSLTTSIEN